MTARLAVLVNLTWLVPGVVGGSEESTTRALRALLEYESGIELTLAVLRSFADAHPDLADACRCEVLDSTGANKAARVAAEQTWLPSRTRELDPDVVHHAGGVVPLRHPGRLVLTVHDLQPLDEPGNFSLAKRAYLALMLRRSVRAADVLCVPSEFTARRAVELLGVAADAVEVVPWCVDGGQQAPDRLAGSNKAGSQPVFLYPAITYPHKNHAVLLEAFAEVLRTRPDARLVLAGGTGPSEDQIRERINRADLVGRVERPGRVSSDEMERLYRDATAVVVPSRYEGFGLPALEAMNRGVPLLVSNAGSLPEVVRSGGRLAIPIAPLDPDDPASWSAAMLSVAGFDEQRRRETTHTEMAAARDYGARRTAGALADAYRHAISRNRA